ncbi:hypothetical protein [Streptomyces sp. NPDC050848]|uniref:hypothetical protein n=1 Tax=Streptomyces sp. NPDC050848 TaxID=3155791 RepID=UPI00340DB05D
MSAALPPLLKGVASEDEIHTVLGGMPHNVTIEMDLALWEVARRAEPHREMLLGTPSSEGVTRYTYTDGDDRYVITYTRHSDLTAAKFIDDLKGPKKAAAKLVGFDGAYLRFTGELRVERYRGEALVERHVDDALWELMYFGKAHA